MQKLHFDIEKGSIPGYADAAYLDDEEDLCTARVGAAYRSLGTDVIITVGGVTMFASAWEDPEHWASDWAAKLGVDYDEAPDAVRGLLAAAIQAA